jgi:hypothetical protein
MLEAVYFIQTKTGALGPRFSHAELTKAIKFRV